MVGSVALTIACPGVGGAIAAFALSTACTAIQVADGGWGYNKSAFTDKAELRALPPEP
ncbi:MAG: hypothetical protein ACRCUT_03245 [Spirochaetota bacterium]